ncbi:MAG: exonuclease domain-containing protein, partial [Bacteroidota bacterium]|nr:exonuclease domain-containing protein [Bacteroidota bacterium]
MFKTSIIIDFETTGVSKLSEVISISYGIKEDEIKTRYYFPLDKSSVSYYYAIKVNGLTDKEIAKRRDSQNATYPKFYKDDAELHKILNSYETFIAHNINFDKNFLQFDITNKNLLCTMQESKSIVNSTDKNGKLKNPKLSECCNYYNIRFSDTQAHNSEYDVLKTIQLAKEVFEYDVEFEKKEIILYTKFTTLPLLVDYSQKDDAKAKGAIWSSKYKIWNFPVSKAKDNDIFQLQKYFPTYYVNTLSIETGECECYNCKKLTPIIRLCSNNSTEFEIGENDNELTIDIEEYYIFKDVIFF